MGKPYNRKIISKALDVISDLKEQHYSDAVLHSKNLIDLLVFYALKALDISDQVRSSRSDEKKLEYLLDKDIISERINDNCLNTKGLRNPTEHIFTFPNSYFARGAALSALELFYALQFRFDLPSIPDLDRIAVELGAEPIALMHIVANRYISGQEMQIILSNLAILAEKYPGPYVALLDFPEGTLHPNGNQAHGFKLDKTYSYNADLLLELAKNEWLSKTEWAGLEIFERLPHVFEYEKNKYPNLV